MNEKHKTKLWLKKQLEKAQRLALEHIEGDEIECDCYIIICEYAEPQKNGLKFAPLSSFKFFNNGTSEAICNFDGYHKDSPSIFMVMEESNALEIAKLILNHESGIPDCIEGCQVFGYVKHCFTRSSF